jgi:hypothetical protein
MSEPDAPPHFILDWQRRARTGLGEAILAEGKPETELEAIVAAIVERGVPMLVTRLEPGVTARLQARFGDSFAPDALSRTAVVCPPPEAPLPAPRVAVVAAGTSDLPIAAEARATLAFNGIGSTLVADVGVAGLWRLLERVEEISRAEAVIAVAGMEGALFSVLAGLVEAPVIAVPAARGYGVATGGTAALSSALASCAPGIVTVNIDNGFGAACAAIKMLRLVDRAAAARG